MRWISVENAQVGQVLSEPLEDARGRVLLPRGAKLSAAVISRLRGWGIKGFNIEGDDEDAASTEQLLEDLQFRFSGFEDDALMMQIKAFAQRHLAGK